MPSEHTVKQLCYAVLLRSIAHSVLPLYTISNAVLLHLIAHVLPTLVVALGTDLLACLVLCKGLELLKGQEGFTLCLEQQNAVESR